jgi:hypothetical protein
MGGDQRGADAGVETHLFVDGTTVGLKGACVASLGLAEHRANQAIKQIESLVGQTGAEVERDGNEGGVAALALESGDMLWCGAAGLAGELGEASLMHAMSSR